MGQLDYRIVVDKLADAVIVADTSGCIVHVNPAAEKLLGWDLAALRGGPLTAIMPERIRHAHEIGFQRYHATRVPRIMGKPIRVPALRKDGRELDIELTLSTLTLPNGETLFVGCLRDLSDRVELERQLRVVRYLQAVADAGVALTTTLDVGHISQTATEILVDGFDAALARLWLYEPGLNLLRLCASAGLSTEVERSSRAVIDVATCPLKIGVVARTMTAVVQNDPRSDPAFDQEWIAREGIMSAAVFPLCAGGELRGVLATFFRHPVDHEVEQALRTIATLVGAALNDALLHEAQRLARQRFEDFANRLKQAIVWEIDAETLTTLFVSGRTVDLLGYRTSRWYEEGRFWTEILHPDDRARVVDTIEQAVRFGREAECEHRFVSESGGVVWMHTGFCLAREASRSRTLVCALSADITHLKDTEARLAASRAQLETILRGVAEGVTAQDPDGRLLYVNERAVKIAGYADSAEMLRADGCIVASRFEILDEEGRPFAPERLPPRLALATGKVHEAVIRLREVPATPDCWCILTAGPVLDGEGSVEMVISVFRDVTDAKRAEHSLRFLAEASAALGASLDYEETLRTVAQLAVPRIADWCIIHLGTPDAPSHAPIVAHVAPERAAWVEEFTRRHPPRPDATRGVTHALRTGQAELYTHVEDDLLRELATNDDYLAALRSLGLQSVMFVPVESRGQVYGVITLATAESGRRYREADLDLAQALAGRAADAIGNAQLYAETERARHRAEEASRIKDDFLATVSHELRTPLSSILGWAAVLQGERTRDSASIMKAAEVIERNARSQLRIIEDILDISRIIRGQVRIETETIDLYAVAREALESIRPAAEAKGIVVRFSSTEAPCPLVADPERIRQILWNVLSNAVKFTPGDGVVSLSIERAVGKLVVEVKDTGQGIAPSFLPFVFDRFRQADESTTRSFGGLGLGLAIVRNLTEMHGGTVSAESAGLGKGATFRIVLPVRPFTTRAPGDSARTASADSAAAKKPLSGLRLLLVEDEPDSRELIQLVLTEGGAEVRATGSADEALQSLDAFTPDMLVSDIGMPGHDGYWLIHEVRERKPSLLAVALTAYARREDVSRARTAGFDEHVGKPVDPDRLVDTLVGLRPTSLGSVRV